MAQNVCVVACVWLWIKPEQFTILDLKAIIKLGIRITSCYLVLMNSFFQSTDLAWASGTVIDRLMDIPIYKQAEAAWVKSFVRKIKPSINFWHWSNTDCSCVPLPHSTQPMYNESRENIFESWVGQYHLDFLVIFYWLAWVGKRSEKSEGRNLFCERMCN